MSWTAMGFAWLRSVPIDSAAILASVLAMARLVGWTNTAWASNVDQLFHSQFRLGFTSTAETKRAAHCFLCCGNRQWSSRQPGWPLSGRYDISKAARDAFRTQYRLEPVSSLAETVIRCNTSKAVVNHPQFYHCYGGCVNM
jgi:hypothetical protein